jgi:HlyD family secretion protein
MKTQPSGNVSKPWLWRLVALGGTIVAGSFFLGLDNLRPAIAPQETPAPLPVATKVVALGRLEPSLGILQIASPSGQDGSRISNLYVDDGSQVRQGQLIAVLDSSKRLKDSVQQAQSQVEAARAKLIQVQAGAKSGEISAQRAVIDRLEADRTGDIATQQATIVRLEAEVKNAQTEFDRFEQLYRAGAIAASERDLRQLTLETAKAQVVEAIAKQQQNQTATMAELAEARATLNQIAQVRAVDINPAQAEVNVAIAGLRQAQTELEQAYIRAPQWGRILKVHARVGEQITESIGIADLAPTQTMMVIAEVYESDINKVSVGQTAAIIGDSIPHNLTGTVMQKGEQIIRQTVFSNQPGENLDRRVVEVKVRLNPKDIQQVVALSNLQVRVEIAL